MMDRIILFFLFMIVWFISAIFHDMDIERNCKENKLMHLLIGTTIVCEIKNGN
jgi:hypothetical protein